MTFQHRDGSAGDARLPNKLCPEAEFLLLMDLKRRAEDRLDEIADIICPDAPHLPLADFRGMAPDVILSGAKPLPRSGAVQATSDGPDLISILGDAPSMENLRNLARSRRDYAEKLIDALDSIDPDPDLEPWLGSGNITPPGRGLPHIFRGPGPERWPMPDHLAFAAEGSDDREEQAEDNDPLDFGEHDEAELSGVGDMDGLCEQVQAWDSHALYAAGGYVA